MPQNYEIADFDTHTPFRCVVHHIGHVPSHMHDFFEILFILSGSCSVTVGEQLFSLRESDVMVVESRTLHELRASECVYASVQLDQATLENNFPVPMHPTFSCNSTFPGKEEAYDSLRRLIAQLINNNANEQNGYELRNWILIYQLMEVLYLHFRVERSQSADRRSHRYAERIAQLSGIISSHYTEDLPLSRVADMVHLSVPYLSKFFQEQFGMNYLTYLTQIRINHAVHELMNTEKTVEEISADSGFPNSHAFTTAFHKEYGTMPSVYRRRNRGRKKADQPIGIEHSGYLSNLRNYLDLAPSRAAAAASSANPVPAVAEKISFSLAEEGRPLTHTWKRTLSVGKAADLLLYDIQALLLRAKKEIGFTGLFFNGIFSDELHVCTRAASGEYVYNFVYVDRLLDFLRDAGFVPTLSFSYMPKVLAKNPDRLLFSHLVSEPADLAGWTALVKAFMKHILERYGENQVKNWNFTVWHQPDTTARLYGFEKDEDFYEFYRVTRQAVKDALPLACFGLPAIFQNADFAGDAWVREMLAWCRQMDCLPDFLNFTYYDTHLSKTGGNTREAFGFVFTMVLNSEPDGLSSFVRQTRQLSRETGLARLPVYLSEWNNTPSQQDLLNDTCYKSCWLAKNLLENYDRLDSFSYWSLSDLMSEAPLSGDLLYGGLGLFTVNGLPKASYYALCLLSRLGDRLIARGDGWFATAADSQIRIIVYHYIHLSRMYASGERFLMTPSDRYTMFDGCPPRTLSITMQELPAFWRPHKESFTIREYLVGRKGGSLYDKWVQSGCPDLTAPMDAELLKASSMPVLRQYPATVQGGKLELDILLDPLDVKLIVVE